jgi:hypothetical protein
MGRVMAGVVMAGLLLAGSSLAINAQEPEDVTEFGAKDATLFGAYKGGAELQVWVTDEDGNPRANVIVCLFHKDDCLRVQWTNDKGFTSFKGIARDEEYKVQVGDDSKTKKIPDDETIVIIHLAC